MVRVLQGEFRMTEDQAHKVMITAHQRGVCVVAVFTRDVAETKATRATDAGRAKGYPLLVHDGAGGVARFHLSPLRGERSDRAAIRVRGEAQRLLQQRTHRSERPSPQP